MFHAELDTNHESYASCTHLPTSAASTIVHTKHDSPTDPNNCDNAGDPTQYSTFLDSRPQKLETDAIELIIKLHKANPSLRFHIVHLSASDALPLIRDAKASGVNLTVETCFHYLCLSSSVIPAGRPEFKCCPPIRDMDNQERLWEGLKEGLIDFVVSDHSPCVIEMKKVDEGDVMGAWGGIGTLGLGMSLLWTVGKKRGMSVKEMVWWMAGATAKHAGLEDCKGKLDVGYDADFVVWDPEAVFQVDKEMLNFKNKLSPYEGTTLTGRVLKTYMRGAQIYSFEQGFEGPHGRLL